MAEIDVEKMLTERMARYFLWENAKKHPKVKAILDSGKTDKEKARELRKLGYSRKSIVVLLVEDMRWG